MSQVLFPEEELVPGETREVDRDGTKIAVVRGLDGRYHAFRNRCPHFGARLSAGRVRQAVDASDLGAEKVAGEQVLVCPWHAFEYSLETGSCIADPKHFRIRPLSIDVVDGQVVLG